MFIPAFASDLYLAKSNGLFSVLVLHHLLAPFGMVDHSFLNAQSSLVFQGHLTHLAFFLPHWWLVLGFICWFPSSQPQC